MKIILSHSIPFSLAHGGTQTVIETLFRHLPQLGFEVEPERWWDEYQQVDIVHYFGRPIDLVAQFARAKGRKIIITEYLDKTARRSTFALFVQALLIRSMRIYGRNFNGRMGWEALRQADALVYATDNESQIAQQLFGVVNNKCHIIPHGLENQMLERLGTETKSGNYIVSVGTIHPRKNSLLLALAAKRADVPVVFLGKPYAEDGYVKAFLAEVDNKTVIYRGFVSEEEKAALLAAARGFVLLSEAESGCIAVYEAAAARLPMLLPDKNWAVVNYAHIPHIKITPLELSELTKNIALFYRQANRLPSVTFEVASWRRIAEMYGTIYRDILNSR